MAADAVAVEWEKPNSTWMMRLSSRLLAAAVSTGSRDVMRDDGDTDIVFADHARDRIVEAEYHVPYLAHAAMEPMNATARFADGKLDLWLPNQAPNLIQAVACRSARHPDSRLHGQHDLARRGLRPPRRAGCRRLRGPYCARNRRPAGQSDLDARGRHRPRLLSPGRDRTAARGTRRDGLPEALDIMVAAPPIFSPMASRFYPSISLPGPDKSIVDGAFNQPYAIANYRVAGVKADIGVPVGIWRSVGNSINGFFP